jgi:hypothetical protein
MERKSKDFNYLNEVKQFKQQMKERKTHGRRNSLGSSSPLRETE